MRFSIVATSTLLLTIFLLMAACGPKKVTDETATACRPANLRVDVNHESMDISWEDDCQGLISGYNVYISDQPLAEKYGETQPPPSVKPFNNATYSGDTNPDDSVEHFQAERLQNGRKYFVSVRVVYPDRTMSPSSNEVAAVCGPRGEVELAIRYKGDHDGYAFTRNEYVSADDTQNDIVFYSKDGFDYLDSPQRLDGFIKANRLRKLPFTGDYDEVRNKAATMKSDPKDDRVAVSKGDWLHLRTPDNTNALVKVIDLYGRGADRRIKLFFAYSPLPGAMIF